MSSTLVESPVPAVEAAPRRQSRLGRALDAKRRSSTAPEPVPLPTAPAPDVPVVPAAPTEAVVQDDSLQGETPNSQPSLDQPQPDPASPEVFDPPMGGSERRVSPRYRVDGDVLAHRWLSGPAAGRDAFSPRHLRTRSDG